MASVPLIPVHEPDDMMLAIELLRDRAKADGHGTLAYLLDIARLEAQQISDQARREAEERDAKPKDLWRPI